MNKFIVCSFATKDTPYESILQTHLADSVQKLKLPFIFYYPPDQRNWYKNVAEKPRIIKNALQEMDDRYDTLVFIDADARIVKYPELFNNMSADYDIGFHLLDRGKWYNKSSDSRHELLSGTMLFKKKPQVFALLDKWYEQAQKTRTWEQIVLQHLLKLDKTIKVYELPLSYCYIAQLPDGREPYVKCDPVIVHYQASRQFKKRQ